MKRIQFLFLFIFSQRFLPTDSAERLWIGHNQVKFQTTKEKQCEGLTIFEESYEALILLDTQVISKLVLPYSGAVALKDKCQLVFAQNSKKCRKQIPLKKVNILDSKNWTPMQNNRAVSLKDRIPCQWDDIVITGDILGLQRANWKIKNLKFLGKPLNNEEFDRIRKSLGGKLVLNGFSVDIDPKNNCTKERCPCQEMDDNIFCYEVFQHIENTEIIEDEDHCADPIEIEGFCRKICGAKIDLPKNFNQKFFKQKLRLILEEYHDQVDFDISVLDNNLETRLVIVDKDPDTGGLEIGPLLDELRSKFSDQIKITMSGKPKLNTRQLKNTFVIFFLTLVANLFLFTLIFVYYQNFGIKPGFKPFIFARFDNADDTMTFDAGLERSEGSNLEIEHRAFDNPMFGQTITADDQAITTESGLEDTELSEIANEDPQQILDVLET